MNRNIFNRSGFSLIGFCRNKALRKVLATWCAFATLATTCSPAFAATTYTEFNSELDNISANVSVDGFAGNGIAGSSDLTPINIDVSAAGEVGVLDWNSLNIPGGKTMNFGLVVGGTFYNIVDSAGGQTAIQGALNGANAANVYIFNPNGVLIGNGAVVNVAGLFGAIAAGINNTGDMITDPTKTIDIGPTVGNITIEGGKILNDALLLGKNVTIDGTIDANNLQFGGNVVIGAGDAIVIDSIGGGTVSFTPSSTTAVNVDLMGAFAKNLSVKASTASVTVDGDLAVGTDSVGDFTIAGADLTVTDNGAVDVEGALTVEKTVAQEGDITVGGDFSVGGNTLTVTTGDLDVGGDLTVKSGTGKVAQDGGTITVAGANGISANVTQDGENTAVKLSAAKISGDVTQKKGSMGIVKTAEVGGDYHMYGGELKSYTDNGDITINGELEQTFESAINVGTGTLVLKGGATQANKDDVGITAGTVELAGAGTETVNLLGNANEIGSIKGSADAVTIDNGEAAVTVADDLTVNTLTVAKITQDGEGKTITSATGKDLVIKGEVTQKAGTIAAASSQKVTIDGAFVLDPGENTAVLGDANNAVEITGDLTQKAGTITASTLTLDGAATQTEGAIINASTLQLADTGKTKTVDVQSKANTVGTVSGTAGSLLLRTSEKVADAGLTVDTLTIGGDTTIVAKSADDSAAYNITFKKANSADTITLSGNNVTEADAASTAITANALVLDATNVKLDEANAVNVIGEVSGTAAKVDLKTNGAADLTVTGLDTSVAGGNITLDAGAKEVKFTTGTTTAGTGTIVLKSAAEVVSGKVTAGEINNSAALLTQTDGEITTSSVTGAFTQNGGTLTSAAGTDLTVVGDVTQNNDGSIVAGKDLSFSGKVTQNGGTIAAADVTDPEDTTTFTVITFSDDVDQNYTHGKPAVIGQASQRNNVIFTKGFAQDAAGTEESATAAPVLNANKVTFNQNIDDGINGTLNIKTIDGSGIVTLTPDEVGDDFTLSGNTTLKVKEVGDNFTQSGGTLTAKDSSGITFAGGVKQTGGQIGESAAPIAIEVKGDLDQTGGTGGTIYATTLKLAGNAQQDANAKVVANQLAVGTGSILLTSINNAIDQVKSDSGKTATVLTLQTTTALNVTALSVSGNTTLTAIDGSTKQNVDFDGVNAIATGDGNTFTVTGNKVTENAGAKLATTKLTLAAGGAVQINRVGNEIYEVGGSAASVDLRTANTINVNALTTTGTGNATIAAVKDSPSMTYTASDYYDVKLNGVNNIGGTFDVSSANLTQESGTLKTAELALPATVVKVNEGGNEIKKVSGEATSVTLATTTDVDVGDLVLTESSSGAADNNLSITAKDGTNMKTVRFIGTGTGTSGNKFTLEAGDVTQTSGSRITAKEIVVDVTPDGDSTGAVTLNGTANAIQQLSGSAASVNLATTTDLTVAGLTTLDTDTDTIPDSGDIVLDAGATKTVTFTGANNVGTGDITVNNSAVDQTSGSITANNLNLNGAASSVAGTVTVATKITNANTLTQNGSTITTPEVTGAFVQTDGTIETADDATLTFGSTVHQNQGSGKTALIGKVDGSGVAKNDIVVTGSLTQDTGTIKAKSLTLKDDSTVKGTVDVIGKIDVAKTPSVKSLTQDGGTIKAGEIDGKFVLKDGSAKFTTITGDVVQDSNTKATAVLEAKTITGSVEQQSGNKGAIQALASGDNGGDGTLTIGTTTDQKTGNLGRIGRTDKSDELTLTGKLTQEQGSIYAKKLTLDGGATQTTVAAPGDEVATIDATTLVANKNTADITALSRDNKFGTLEGTGNDIKIVDSEGGLTIGALTANSLNAKVTGDVTGTSAISLAGGSSKNSKIDATGKIELKNATSELHNNGTAAAGYIDLDAADVIIVAKDVSLGAVSAKKNPSVGSASVTVSGDLVANGKVDVVAASADAITLKSTGGAVTLKDTVTTGSGNIKITGNTVTAETPADISNGTVGNIEIKAVTGNASLGGTVAAGQKLTVESTAGQVTFAKNITAGNDLTVTAGTDVTLSGNATSGAALSITADDNITTATGKALQGQTVAISADDNGDADGDPLVNGTGKADMKASIKATVGDVTVAGYDVEFADNVEANGDVTVTAANDVSDTASKTVSGKNVTLTATAGDATVNGTVVATTGKTSVKATAGDVTVAGTVKANAGDVDVTAGTDVSLTGTASLEATKKLTVEAGNDIADAAATTALSAKDLVLTADKDANNTGKVEIKGVVTATGTTTLSAAGDISLANAANNFTGTVTADNAANPATTPGNIALKDASDLKLGSVTAAGGVSAIAGDELSVLDNAMVSAADGNLKLVAGAGKDLSIGKGVTVSAAHSAGTTAKVNLEAGNNVTINDKATVSATLTPGAGAKADMTITAGNNVVVNDGATVKTVGVPTAATDSADVTITAGNDIKVVDDSSTLPEASVVASGNMTLHADKDITTNEKTSITVGGDIDADSDNKEIAISGTIAVAGDADLTAVKGKVTALNAGNDFNKVTATSTEVLLKDKDNIVLGDITATSANNGIQVSTENGDITVVGVLTSHNSSGSAANIILTAGNDALTPTPGAGSIAIENDGTAAKAGAIVSDRDVVLTANGGSVSILGTDTTAAKRPSITAAKKVDITAGTSVDIESATIAANGGDVTVTAETSIDMKTKNGSDVYTGDAAITASRNVTLKSNSTTAGNITIATEGATTGAKSGTITAEDGAVTIDNDNGNVSIANAKIDAKRPDPSATPLNDVDVKVEATGNVAIDNVAATAADDIEVAAGGTATVSGTALTATSGDLTITAGGADTSVAALLVSGDSTLSAEADGKKVSLSATTGSAELKDTSILKAGDYFEINGKVRAKVGSSAKATANGTASTPVANSGKAIITAQTGEATVDGTVTAATTVEIEATADKAAVGGTVTANDGDITVTAGKAIMIDGALTAKDGGTTGAGDIVVTANGNDAPATPATAVLITTAGSLTADKSVSITATDATAASAITIDTTGAVTAKDGSVTINNAKGDVTIKNATVKALDASAAADTTLADIDIDATGAVVVDAATLSADDNVLVGDNATPTPHPVASFAAQNGASVTAAKSVEVYAAGDATIAKGTGSRTEVAGLSGVTLEVGGGVDVNAAVVKAGNVNETTGAVSGTPADLSISAGDEVVVEGGALVGASGKATIVAAGDDSTAAKNGVVVKGTGTKLVSEDDMSISATKAAGAAIEVSDKAYIATHGAMGISSTAGKVTVKDAGTNVESAKAMTVSGTGIEINAARVGTSKGLTMTATDGDVDVLASAVVIATDDISVDAQDADSSGADGNVKVDASTVKSTAGNVFVGTPAVPGTPVTPAVPVAGAFTADNGASVTAAKNVEIYSTGNATIAKGTGSRTEVVGLTGVTVDAGGFVDVDAAVVKAGDINETTGAFTGSPANLSVSAGDYVKVEKGALVGASGTATVTAAGDDSTVAKNGVVVTGTGTKLVSQDNMSISTTSAGGAAIEVSDKAYVATHGTMGATATGKVTVKDTTTVVESTKAMTVSGTDVEIDNARLGTSDTLSVTATAVGGDIDVKNAAQITAAKNTTLTAGNDVKTAAASSLTVGNSTTASDLSVTANGGKIDMLGVTTVQGATVLQSDSTITANNAANDFVGAVSATEVAAANAGAVTLKDGTGGIQLGNVNAASLTVDSTAGAITQTAATTGDKVVVVGATTLTASNGGTPATVYDITLNEANNDFRGTVNATGDDIALKDSVNDIDLGTVTAKGTLTVDATDTAAGKGNVTDSGTLTIAGVTTVTAKGNITLDTPANDFTGAVNADGANVELVDANGITLGKVQTAAVGTTSTGTLKVKSVGGGTITQTAATTDGIVAVGETTIETTGAVALNTAANNDFQSEVNVAGAFAGTGGAASAAAGAVDIRDNSATGIQLGDVSANSLAVESTAGAITQTASTTPDKVVVATTTTLKANTNVTLDNNNNDFIGAVSATGVAPGSAAANVTLADANSIELDVVKVSGNLDVTANAGNITQTAATGLIEAGNTSDLKATGNITVDSAANDFGGAVTASGLAGAGTPPAAANVTIVDKNNLTIANVDTVGNADVKAANNLTTTGKIAAGNTATTEATTGAATVNTDSPYLNVKTGGDANVNVLAGGAYNPSGDLTIDSNGPAIGSSSVVAGGNVSLNVAGKLSTTGSAEINAGGNLDVKASTASTPLNIKVGGSTIGIDLANQAAVALNDHDKTYTVNGNGSHTAILIDGRLAGGDPRYFSVLSSYEGEAARGVVDGPLPVPYVGNAFAAPFITLDMPLAVPGLLGQYYMQGEAGSVDAGDAFPEADTALSIPGLPANSTIFFIPREEAKNKTAAL